MAGRVLRGGARIFLLALVGGCPQGRELFTLEPLSRCDQGATLEAVSWEEETELGLSARAAFEPTRACDAKLTWNADWSGPSIEPRKGETTLAIRVSPRKRSATLVKPTANATSDCRASLRVEADLSFSSADGNFVDRGRVQLAYTEDGVVFARMPSSEHGPGGALRIRPETTERLALDYLLSFHGEQCAGYVNLQANRRELGEFMSFSLGSWSSTGCTLGEQPIALAKHAQAAALAEQISRAFRAVSYVGGWDDGSTASLTVAAERASDFACVFTEGKFSFPVRVTYGTDDGRIETHSAAGRATAEPADEVPLRLGVSELVTCAPGDDALVHADALCGERGQLFVSLRLKNDGEALRVETRPALELVEYQSEITAVTPERLVQTFSLTPE